MCNLFVQLSPHSRSYRRLHIHRQPKPQQKTKRKRTSFSQSCVVVTPSADLVVAVPPSWARGVFFVLHELAELCTLPGLFYTRPSRLLHSRLQMLQACTSANPHSGATQSPPQWRALHEAVVLVHAFCLCVHARHPTQSRSGSRLVLR